MGAALALLILLAGSVFIVRIAAVALRLTGLPDTIARFQALSALTGAGFTTSESEAIVNYPVRRRIIAALMFLGNLGLISVLSTFVVAFTNTDGDIEAVVSQAIAILAVVFFLFILVTNKTLDNILCGAIEWILVSTTSLDEQPFRILMRIDDEHVVAEHSYRGQRNILLRELLPLEIPITLLWIKDRENEHASIQNGQTSVISGELLTFLGSIMAHRHLAIHLKKIGE